jgi:hypothetical protein
VTISDTVKLGFADSINATVPATSGAEKLVPTVGFVLSEKTLSSGDVFPLFVAAMRG